MSETARGRAFLATRIKTDPTVLALLPDVANRVFSLPAPSGTPYPYLRMEILSGGSDVITLPLSRYWSNPLFLVYWVTDKQSTTTIEPLADRTDALLNGASGAVAAVPNGTGGLVWSTWRERPFDMPDTSVVPGVSRLGGEYRMLVSAA